MCFTILINKGKKLKKYKAKKDMVVLKRLYEMEELGCCKSEIYDYEYFLNRPNPKVTLKPYKHISEDNIIYYTINEGYHSYRITKEINHAKWDNALKYKTFIIPKGTYYYYEPCFKEYVSETITYVGEYNGYNSNENNKAT